MTPTEYRVSFQTSLYLLMQPPLGIMECPRCGDDHPRLKTAAFARPMKLSRPKPDGTQEQVAQASYFGTCPTLKEPIIFHDRAVTSQNYEEVLKALTEGPTKHLEDPKFIKQLRDLKEEFTKTGAPPLKGEAQFHVQVETKSIWAVAAGMNEGSAP